MSIQSILVVDDSPTQLDNIKNIVADAGFRVITADSGVKAIEKAEAEMPDLIFMDVVMPDMDGFQTCRKLTLGEKTKDIPIVFVTTKNQKADKVWAQMQGGKALVGKPYEADEIIDQIKAFN
ncbi:MAG: response regulator [Methyloprofundus sp.]|nr:response regulator [Methyloprofundus sp.]